MYFRDENRANFEFRKEIILARKNFEYVPFFTILVEKMSPGGYSQKIIIFNIEPFKCAIEMKIMQIFTF